MLPIQRRPSCSPTPSTTPDFRAVAPLPEPGRGRRGGGPCNVSSVTLVYFPPTGNARQASAAMNGDRIYQTKPIVTDLAAASGEAEKMREIRRGGPGNGSCASLLVGTCRGGQALYFIRKKENKTQK